MSEGFHLLQSAINWSESFDNVPALFVLKVEPNIEYIFDVVYFATAKIRF